MSRILNITLNLTVPDGVNDNEVGQTIFELLQASDPADFPEELVESVDGWE